MDIKCSHTHLVPVLELKPHPKNRNHHGHEQIQRLAKILQYQGWRYPVKVSKRSGFVTSGHGRIEAAKLNNWKEIPVDYQDYETDEQEYADVQSDNAIASWAELDIGGINMDLSDLGPDFDIEMLGIKDFVLEPAEKFEAKDNALMRDKFLYPPFSVLNAREGDWQNRKRAWVDIGIQSELGRGGGRNDGELQKPGTTLGATPPNQKDLYKRMSGK